MPVTVELALGAVLVSLAIGVPTGVVAALRQNRGTDMLLRVGTLLGLSIPSFWQGTILILLLLVLPTLGAAGLLGQPVRGPRGQT